MGVSVFNAVRNICSDSFWAIKLLFFTAPVFATFHYDLLEKYGTDQFMLMAIIASTFYFGSATFLMHQNINNESPILPSLFKIPTFLKSFVFGSIFSLPMFALYAYVIKFVAENFTAEQLVMWVIYGCITVFMAPFLFVPVILYSANEKITDPFNLKIVYEASGNFSVAFLSFIIQYVFIIGIPWYLLYRVFYEMVTIDTCVNVINSFFFVLSFFVFYSYCSDAYGEVIPKLKKKKKVKYSRGLDVLDD